MEILLDQRFRLLFLISLFLWLKVSYLMPGLFLSLSAPEKCQLCTLHPWLQFPKARALKEFILGGGASLQNCPMTVPTQGGWSLCLIAPGFLPPTYPRVALALSSRGGNILAHFHLRSPCAGCELKAGQDPCLPYGKDTWSWVTLILGGLESMQRDLSSHGQLVAVPAQFLTESTTVVDCQGAPTNNSSSSECLHPTLDGSPTVDRTCNAGHVR